MENPEEGTMIDSNKSETRLEEYHQRTRRENLFRKGRRCVVIRSIKSIPERSNHRTTI